ncbi:MAG TPA: hypothetical protein VF447_02515, partial [Terriglobales bacterium]
RATCAAAMALSDRIPDRSADRYLLADAFVFAVVGLSRSKRRIIGVNPANPIPSYDIFPT